MSGMCPAHYPSVSGSYRYLCKVPRYLNLPLLYVVGVKVSRDLNLKEVNNSPPLFSVIVIIRDTETVNVLSVYKDIV